MKNNRFIELVNLYIDRQITREEMAALEAEIQANPDRRAIYRQYCQIHRATSLVYDSFRQENASRSPEAATSGTSVTPFKSRNDHRPARWAYYATGLAAACAALAFVRVNFNQSTAQRPSNIALQATQAAPLLAAQTPVAAPTVAAVVAPVNEVAARTNSLVAQQDYAAMLAAMRQEDRRAFASGQVQSSRTSSLFEDGIFDAQPTGSSRVFRKKETTAQQAEFAAFQFQR